LTVRLQPLGANQRAALANSSRLAIENGLSRLRRFLRSDRWLSRDNRYRLSPVHVLEEDAKANTIDEEELVQYVAASGTLHCSDGWSLLGRALACHARGDTASALHLAYYAELRACVSILASQGIGVFDDPSVSVGSTGNCHLIRGYRTHVLAWLALENWADTQSAADLLVDTLSIQGIRCKEWLDNFQKSSVVNRSRIASKWLKTWGLDLRRFIDDREARNTVSYQPSRISPLTRVSALESSDFLCELWKLHEPSAESRFENLDRYLLRRILEETYRVVRGRLPKSDPVGFEADIESMINQMNPGGLTADEWVRFFARKADSNDPSLITMAMNTRKQESSHSHMQVISRAVIMLRVATGACSNLLGNVKFGKTQLEFWWESLAQDLGLWSDATRPDNITDLWADVASAITQLSGWAESNKTTANYANWQSECASGISVLGSCERIALWGLGL
jgi:hypothetical protein